MNTWKDIETENPVIRPINIKRFDFVKHTYVDSNCTLRAIITDKDGNSETTPPTKINQSGVVTHCLKFEMTSDLGEEMGVGVIFCMKNK